MIDYYNIRSNLLKFQECTYQSEVGGVVSGSAEVAVGCRTDGVWEPWWSPGDMTLGVAVVQLSVTLIDTPDEQFESSES